MLPIFPVLCAFNEEEFELISLRKKLHIDVRAITLNLRARVPAADIRKNRKE